MIRSQLEDPVGIRNWPVLEGRDPERTPMPWTGGDGAGFTSPGTTPWLPIGDNDAVNVDVQRDDPGSILTFCRALLAVRRGREELRRGTYEALDAPDGVWVFRRGTGTTVALNFSSVVQQVDVVGEVLFSTAGDTTAETGDGLHLRPWEGVIVSV
jgi:alpha-glucosidase